MDGSIIVTYRCPMRCKMCDIKPRRKSPHGSPPGRQHTVVCLCDMDREMAEQKAKMFGGTIIKHTTVPISQGYQGPPLSTM